MAEKNSTAPEPTGSVPSTCGGANAYAIGIEGDALAPTLRDGQVAVFDPDGGRAHSDDIVALWLHGDSGPAVVKLAMATPPESVGSNELTPMLVIHGPAGKPRTLAMSRVSRVDRLVEVVGAMNQAEIGGLHV